MVSVRLHISNALSVWYPLNVVCLPAGIALVFIARVFGDQLFDLSGSLLIVRLRSKGELGVGDADEVMVREATVGKDEGGDQLTDAVSCLFFQFFSRTLRWTHARLYCAADSPPAVPSVDML